MAHTVHIPIVWNIPYVSSGDEFYAKSIAETLNAWSREFNEYYYSTKYEKWKDNEDDSMSGMIKYNDEFLDNHPLIKYDKNFCTIDETSYFVEEVEFYPGRTFFDETQN